MGQHSFAQQPMFLFAHDPSRARAPQNISGQHFMTTSTKPMKHMLTLVVSAALFAIGLSACNTVEGAGQDLESTGRAIERTADDNK